MDTYSIERIEPKHCNCDQCERVKTMIFKYPLLLNHLDNLQHGPAFYTNRQKQIFKKLYGYRFSDNN